MADGRSHSAIACGMVRSVGYGSASELISAGSSLASVAFARILDRSSRIGVHFQIKLDSSGTSQISLGSIECWRESIASVYISSMHQFLVLPELDGATFLIDVGVLSLACETCRLMCLYLAEWVE